MMPHCAVVSDSIATVVNVLTPEQMRDDDTATPTADPSRSDDPGVTTAVDPSSPAAVPPAAADTIAATGGAATVVAATPTRSKPAPSGSIASPTTGSGTQSTMHSSAPPVIDDAAQNAVSDEVAEVKTIPFDTGHDSKGVRLLASIATICVLGVTAAIIRAIVSKRTMSSVS